MMDKDRYIIETLNRYLPKEDRACWHEADPDFLLKCRICGEIWPTHSDQIETYKTEDDEYKLRIKNPNFTTWEGFGFLARLIESAMRASADETFSKFFDIWNAIWNVGRNALPREVNKIPLEARNAVYDYLSKEVGDGR